MAGFPDVAWWSMCYLEAEALWALMHINEIEYCQTRQSLLPATTKLGQGNIFTSGVSRILSTGGGGCLPQCMLGYTPLPGSRHPPPGSRHPPEQTPPQEHTPPQEQTPPEQTPPQEADCSIRSTSGRYASYWNALLFTVRKENYTNSLNEFMLLIPLPPYSQDESKISQT